MRTRLGPGSLFCCFAELIALSALSRQKAGAVSTVLRDFQGANDDASTELPRDKERKVVLVKAYGSVRIILCHSIQFNRIDFFSLNCDPTHYAV